MNATETDIAATVLGELLAEAKGRIAQRVAEHQQAETSHRETVAALKAERDALQAERDALKAEMATLTAHAEAGRADAHRKLAAAAESLGLMLGTGADTPIFFSSFDVNRRGVVEAFLASRGWRTTIGGWTRGGEKPVTTQAAASKEIAADFCTGRELLSRTLDGLQASVPPGRRASLQLARRT